MRTVFFTLGLLAALVIASPAPAGQVARANCCKTAPPAVAFTPAQVAPAMTTFSTPATVVETPATQYTVTVPGERQVIPGQSYTVATPAAAPVAYAPSYTPAVGYAAAPAVDVDVKVMKKARLRTFFANHPHRHQTVVATPASAPLMYAPACAPTAYATPGYAPVPTPAYLPAAPTGPCELEGIEVD